MTQRRTYYGPGAHAQRNQFEEEEPEAEPSTPPPAPSTWLRTTLSIAFGAVVGAVAVDLYRRYFGKNKNPEGDEMVGGFSASGAIPGAPSIMPMPMPMPMPWPMPMPNYGAPPPVAPGYRDERALTEHEQLEMARLNAEKAKAEADRARWEAWESGEID